MTPLDPTLKLRRVPDLKLQVASNNNVVILRDGEALSCGPHGLAVLDLFHRPTTLHEALGSLSSRIRGAQEWTDLTSTIIGLYRRGVLSDESEARPIVKEGAGTFDSAPIHIKMLNDTDRVHRYVEALRALVRPTDVVVDIGTGTGVLAVAAARAGAHHVYAVEASGMGELARAVFRENGLEDRITLIQGWSSQIELPERADLMVSEIIGNEPLGEHVIEFTRDAVQRLLKPGARLVPGRIRVLGLPVALPPEELSRRIFTHDAARAWREWYGISFQALADASHGSSNTFFVKPHRARDWTALSDPVLLADLDLREISSPALSSSSTATATGTGVLSGILVYFELELAPGVWLSTHPARADERCSWRLMVRILGIPHRLHLGDTFDITYTRAGARAATDIEVRPTGSNAPAT